MTVADEASLGGLPGPGEVVLPEEGSEKTFGPVEPVEFLGAASPFDSFFGELSSSAVDGLVSGVSPGPIDSSPKAIALSKGCLFVLALEGLSVVREFELLLESVRIILVRRDLAPVELGRGVVDPDWSSSESGLDRCPM